jgi:hypothetical protein
MPHFLFTARMPAGQETSGLVGATTELEASTKLAKAGYTGIWLAPAGELPNELPPDGFFAWLVLAIGQALSLRAVLFAPLLVFSERMRESGWTLPVCAFAFVHGGAMFLVFSRAMDLPRRARRQAIAQAIAVAKLRQELEDLRQGAARSAEPSTTADRPRDHGSTDIIVPPA